MKHVYIQLKKYWFKRSTLHKVNSQSKLIFWQQKKTISLSTKKITKSHLCNCMMQISFGKCTWPISLEKSRTYIIYKTGINNAERYRENLTWEHRRELAAQHTWKRETELAPNNKHTFLSEEYIWHFPGEWK